MDDLAGDALALDQVIEEGGHNLLRTDEIHDVGVVIRGLKLIPGGHGDDVGLLRAHFVDELPTFGRWIAEHEPGAGGRCGGRQGGRFPVCAVKPIVDLADVESFSQFVPIFGPIQNFLR